MPPIKKPGSQAASRKIQAISEVVVVFPCVPVTKSVPDDDQIDLRRDIFWSESARNLDSLRLEERGHWGVDVVVGPRDDETEFPERGGNRAHGSPANS